MSRMTSFSAQGDAISLDVLDIRGRGALSGGIVRSCDDEQLSRPVDQDHLSCFGLDFLSGSFDVFAIDEGRSGAHQGDQVGGVDGTPAVLR